MLPLSFHEVTPTRASPRSPSDAPSSSLACFLSRYPKKSRTPAHRLPQSSLPKGNGFPFPSATNKPGVPKPPCAAQARRSPMYAITIILHLPVSQSSPTLRPQSRGANFRNAAHLSTSIPGQDSLGSSLDSDRRAGWAFVESNLGVESLLSASMSSDVDDRVDVVGLIQHHCQCLSNTAISPREAVSETLRRTPHGDPFDYCRTL
jgi:hypothetical protein